MYTGNSEILKLSTYIPLWVLTIKLLAHIEREKSSSFKLRFGCCFKKKLINELASAIGKVL